ncbi:hypothetical protein L0F63_002351 [Massospora cicadina]|nr:hypothetical protein L0F63_002351 [Massospora cicadina]
MKLGLKPVLRKELMIRDDKEPPKVVAETAEEDEDPENKRPRIFFDFPRYSDQLRTSLIPKGGSVVLKWHIEPKPKPNKTIDIALEKRDAYTTLLPIASNLTTSTNSFTWEVGVAKRGKKYSTPLNIGDYKLWIFESNKEYLNVEGDIIPASTPVTIFAPIDVSANSTSNRVPTSYTRGASEVQWSFSSDSYTYSDQTF